MYIVKLLLEAELDLAEACKWYEKRRSGLGKEFLDEFDRRMDVIAGNPLLFAVNFSERYRFAMLKKFPFSIVYRIDDDENSIVVISVFHQNRNPYKF